MEKRGDWSGGSWSQTAGRMAAVRGLLMVAVAGAFLGPACASQAGAVKEAGPQIALRRGGSVSTYSVKLPAILGSTAQLRLEGQMLQGFVGPGTLHLKIVDDGASGFGPSGPIDVTIRRQGGDVVVDGLWNGGPMHLVLGASRIEGTVVRWGASVGRPAVCGYDLGPRDPGGAFVGTSICQGLPERTWLEIDGQVDRTLKPAERAVLLVTILANCLAN